jgi:hypothetical protein
MILDSRNQKSRFISGNTAFAGNLCSYRETYLCYFKLLSLMDHCINVIDKNRKTVVSEPISSKKLFFKLGGHPNI